MDILGPLVDFWLDGGFDVMRHPISYYRLSHAVRNAEKAVNERIGHGDSLEDVATVLAAKLPRIEELGKIYQGGEPLPLPAYTRSAETLASTPVEEKAWQSFERAWHGPTRRRSTVTYFLSDLWMPFYDYGIAKGLNHNQIEQLAFQ